MLTYAATAEPLPLRVSLEPAVQRDVVVFRSGIVDSFFVAVGDTVTKGDTLAVLQPDQNASIVAKAHLDYQWAAQQLTQAELLHQQGGLAAQAVAAHRLKQQQASIAWQEALRIQHLRWIIAPHHGLVAQLALETATPVAKGQAIARLIQAEDLKAMLYIPADQLHRIHRRMAVAAQLYADGPTLSEHITLSGHITTISPWIDPASGTCQIEALFPGAGRHTRPGHVVLIHLETYGREVD